MARRHANKTMERIALGLGAFSVALGLAELVAPRFISRTLGMKRGHMLLRAFGARELGAGIGLLADQRKRPWLWARVGGDVLDLSALGAAIRFSHRKTAAAAAAASVAAITALDTVTALRHH